MKPHHLILFLLLAFMIFFSSCEKNTKRDISDYYLPLGELKGAGLVYEYRFLGNDSIAPEYWHYRSETTEEGTFLSGTNYNVYREPRQSIREEKVGNGMLLNELNLFYIDSTGAQQILPVEIIAGNTFPFTVTDSLGVFIYEIKLPSPDNPFETTTLVKNRRYTGETVYTFKGKKLKCVRFKVKELYEVDDSKLGGLDPQRYDGLEIYAKGIGLVYYKKQVTEGFALEYELVDRYPLEGFK